MLSTFYRPESGIRVLTPEEQESRMLDSLKTMCANLDYGESLLITRHNPASHEHGWWFEVTKLTKGAQVHHPPDHGWH